MDGSPLRGLRAVDAATDLLLATAAGLDDAACREPSLCTGWTRGHVLTHLARNADGLVNLLTWAATGQQRPMYASRASRDADIEAGAGRGARDLLADLRAAAERFAGAAGDLPAAAWDVVVRRRDRPLPAREIPWMRQREIEIHHVDLAAGYGPADWPEEFVRAVLDEQPDRLADRDDMPALVLHGADSGKTWVIRGGGATVSGPEPALLAWLLGRSSGEVLAVEGGAPLPALPAWG